jgi:hypothetical protein
MHDTHDTTETVIEALFAHYVHELCADMRGFRDGAVYAWFAHAARGWDDERTAAHLTVLTTELVGAPEHNEEVYDRVRALARRQGFAVRASDDRALPLRDILVSGGVITVSAYANVTTVQWVVLAALFLAQVTVGAERPPDVVAVARAYGAAYGALRALGVDTPNAARALVLEGVPPAAVEDNIDEIARLVGTALRDVEPLEARMASV